MKPSFVLHSPETETDYSIFVVSPDVKQNPRPWPAVLFMDGDDQFADAVDAYQILRKVKRVPAMLLVGVGYGASYSKPLNCRGRDYTPTAHSDEPTSGGANAFLAFLQRTLWPELNRRYSVSNDSRGISGHSLGSLLVLYALLQEPSFFTHYLASAPSIWWDNRSILRLAEERRARSAALAARLFLSVGADDTDSMTGDLALLEEQLKSRPFSDLEFAVRSFADRDHFDVLPDAFREGLSFLYDKNVKFP